LAKETNAWLVFGTPYYDGSRGYNSIAVLSPSGEITSRYDKQRLVPFGEYLPFRWVLYPFLKTTGFFDGDFSAAPKVSPIVINGVPVGAAVCFESTFTGTMRERAKGTKFLLTVTNDGWFGDSAAASQHLDAGVFRAIENRQYFIQAANTGISALIDPNGRVLKRSQLNKREILTFEVPLR
jgi:apolipoprotein N-acyltransferase